MSALRIVGWIVALAAGAIIYTISIFVTGEHSQNGAWVLLVLTFTAAGADLAAAAIWPKQ